MRRLSLSLSLLFFLVPTLAYAQAPPDSPELSSPELSSPELSSPELSSSELSSPELSSSGPMLGPPPPEGKHMYRAGMFFTIFGALQVGVGSAFLAHMTWGDEPVGEIVGTIPLVFGGGYMVLGALWLHFGEERRWAYEDWQAGRPCAALS